VWIVPERRGLAPSYEQKTFSATERRGNLRLIGSRNGRDGSVTIHQDVDVHAGLLGAGENARYEVLPSRHVWIHLARGSAAVNGVTMGPGDGASIEEVGPVEIRGVDDAEMLVFDLA
ncbi:MAG: pirin family protein, partial [Polyangiaceae bacterium]|nr:pirin family protein [Polyangiaceae bacterium]